MMPTSHCMSQAQRPHYIFSAWADQPTRSLNDDRFRVTRKGIDVWSRENSDFSGDFNRGISLIVEYMFTWWSIYCLCWLGGSDSELGVFIFLFKSGAIPREQEVSDYMIVSNLGYTCLKIPKIVYRGSLLNHPQMGLGFQVWVVFS